MALVELVGPPTVGKSTLVAACVRRGAHDARRSLMRPRHPALGPLADWARRAASGDGLLQSLAGRLLVVPDDAWTEAQLAAVARAWAPFLDLVLGASTPPDDRALGVMERAWLLEAIRLRALLEPERAAGRLDLLDEGVTHPFKVRAVAGDDTVRSEAYARVVPLPDILVVLDADPAVLVPRVRARYATAPARVRWASFGPDADDARIEDTLRSASRTAATIAQAAEDRGCPVIRIDVGDGPIERTATVLLERLRSTTDRAGADLR